MSAATRFLVCGVILTTSVSAQENSIGNEFSDKQLESINLLISNYIDGNGDRIMSSINKTLKNNSEQLQDQLVNKFHENIDAFIKIQNILPFYGSMSAKTTIFQVVNQGGGNTIPHSEKLRGLIDSNPHVKLVTLFTPQESWYADGDAISATELDLYITATVIYIWNEKGAAGVEHYYQLIDKVRDSDKVRRNGIDKELIDSIRRGMIGSSSADTEIAKLKEVAENILDLSLTVKAKGNDGYSYTLAPAFYVISPHGMSDVSVKCIQDQSTDRALIKLSEVIQKDN